MIQTERTSERFERAEISVRVAAYPPENGAPEVTEVSASNPGSATAKITSLVEHKVGEFGGEVSPEAVREIVENLLHADYRGVIISILDGGDTVRVSDKGPGISDKARAREFGFSGAESGIIEHIRGVGAGLGIASEEVRKAGGSLSIEDNIGGGTVVTISRSAAKSEDGGEDVPDEIVASSEKKYLDGVPRINISERQQKTLVTVLECGEVGPSTIAERVEVSVSTAYRDLSVLEEHGLVVGDESGKRMISPLGRDYVEALIGTWVR